MSINPKLKEWFIGALMMLVLTLLVRLINKYTGEKVVIPPPPLSVVIQPGPDKSDPFTGAKAFAVPVEVSK